jgi:flap endonuclease-1
MGIKGLNKIINQYAPEAISYVNISEFSGSKVAIDSELLLHKFRSNESDNSHIFGFLINILWYIKNGITPVYVFDGSPNIHKQNNAIFKRSSYKEQLYQKAGDIEDKIEKHSEFNNNIGDALGEEFNELCDKLYKIQKKMTCMSVSKKHRNECKYLLKLLGVPYIIANDDAEAFCVTLQRKGLVDYVYTEDTDIIPYYVASFINNENTSNKPIKFFRTTNYSKNPYHLREYNSNNKMNKYDIVTVVNIDIIMNKLKLSNESFIDMCILCGCDFCPPFPKITHEKAFNIIKKYNNIENFINTCSYVPIEFKFKEAREVFYNTINQNVEIAFNLEQINVISLKIYLSEERLMNTFLINSIISKYNKMLESFNLIEARQSSLGAKTKLI